MTLAAVDRLVHHATILEMNVESYRRRTALERKRGPGRPAAQPQPKILTQIVAAQGGNLGSLVGAFGLVTRGGLWPGTTGEPQAEPGRGGGSERSSLCRGQAPPDQPLTTFGKRSSAIITARYPVETCRYRLSPTTPCHGPCLNQSEGLIVAVGHEHGLHAVGQPDRSGVRVWGYSQEHQHIQ